MTGRVVGVGAGIIGVSLIGIGMCCVVRLVVISKWCADVQKVVVAHKGLRAF